MTGGCGADRPRRTLPSQQYELPHDVRHAAIAEALQSLGVRVVVGVGSVGALNSSCTPGHAVVPSDYYNLFGVESGLTDERAHISPQYDALLRLLLAEVAQCNAGATERSVCVSVFTSGT